MSEGSSSYELRASGRRLTASRETDRMMDDLTAVRVSYYKLKTVALMVQAGTITPQAAAKASSEAMRILSAAAKSASKSLRWMATDEDWDLVLETIRTIRMF